ncbi:MULTISPECIES: rhamnogalacturonan acetylesterase [Flavobacteriaceae]|uniref:rhamnogalacturonan acetylesterase n=1 Tax=Flavobacteriaceae TaxID=49546 RepID=UPI001492DA18|nr:MULTISPECIES: rhamnogalacturonan acetylesterase [Allomuricauda]MDC6367635.1 rhamnogalacturonan acetylesterase [Muricauda sp. AC10]
MKKTITLFCLALSAIFISCNPKQTKVPTLYTVGDSTVKNGHGDGADGLWGWGDFLSQFMDSTKIKLENHALGGTSTRTYIDKGLWDSVSTKLKKGDYILIQFGHNDDGPINDTIRARGTIRGIGNETEEIDNMLTGKHEVVHSYGWYLRQMIKDAKNKGAKPILITPIPRNRWHENKVARNTNDYGLWVKQVSEQEAVPHIDLNDFMATTMEKIGKQGITNTYFYDWDTTHTNDKGAALAAELVADALKGLDSFFIKTVLNNPVINYPSKRNIYLIGDSTMANNDNENAVGWGVPFLQYVDTLRVNLYNKARGGRSSRTFRYEGLWDSVKKVLTPRDFVIIQFGHNDAGNISTKKYRGSLSGIGEETQKVTRNDSIKETVHTFGWYLEHYIKDCKEIGAEPLLMSLTPRNEWPNGNVEQRSGTYIKWTKQIAEKERIKYIDLSDSIAKTYQKLGAVKVADFFPKDHTHTNMAGADLNARIAAESLKKLKGSDITYFIKL